MEIVFYVIIFILGSILGSIYAKLIESMSKERKSFFMQSYCSKCGEKLSILEQIPIFSYMFLKGKCKYCGKPIKRKYIILEIITPLLLLTVAYSLNLYYVNITNLLSFIFIILYFTYIILSAGIDLEKRKMPSTLLAAGIIISIAYIIYLCFSQGITIYASMIYLITIILLLLLNIINTKKKAQSSYVIDLLTMLLIMLVFTGEIISILTICGTLITVASYILINKIKQLKLKTKKDLKIFSLNMKIVFILGTLNIIIFLILLNINK